MFAGLRPYQDKLITEGFEALKSVRRVLLQCPTGGGKTVIARAAADVTTSLHLRVWFLCHRKELVFQTSQTFVAAGIEHSFIAAGREFRREPLVHICSVDTLGSRLDKVELEPDIVIWDECHHIAAGTWARIMKRYPNAWHIGLSATPERANGEGLDAYFDLLIQGPQPAELMALGALSNFRYLAPSQPDLRGVKTAGSDFGKEGLEDACNKPKLVGDAVADWKSFAQGLRTCVFAVSVKHSKEIAAAFNAAGIPAEHVDGETGEEARAEAIRKFADGELQVITNVELFGEGFDLSAIAGRPVTIDCVMLLRPTKSLRLYLQQVGRALRPSPGKTAVIIDNAGNVYRHGLPDQDRAWSLTGVPKKEREAAVSAPFDCRNCYHQVKRPTPSHCPYCGAEIPKQDRTPQMTPGELKELTRQAMEAEKAAKAAAKEAAKQEREERLKREAEERRLAAEKRRQEERECKSLEELVELGKRRGYRYPKGWAEQRMGSSRYMKNKLSLARHV